MSPGSSREVRPKSIPLLDALRGFAASYVVLHHAQLTPNRGLGMILYFGQEAVILFFVLSGFVIDYSTRQKGHQVRDYLAHRARRIFPIFLLALAFSYLSAAIVAGRLVDPKWMQLLGNIAMLQDVESIKRGVIVDTYYANSPLWSLSYEWWFYLAYIPLGISKGLRQNASLSRSVAMAISTAGWIGYQCHPNQFSLFAGYLFIWWAGVELSREYSLHGSVTFFGQRWTIAGMCWMTLLWAAPVVVRVVHRESVMPGTDPVLQLRHHVAALCILLAAVIFIRRGAMHRLPVVLAPFVQLAPISYAVYLIHVPLLSIGTKWMAGAPHWATLLAVVPVLIFFGWLLEVKLQGLINRRIQRA